ncbi:MAG: hypothetical protein ABIA75_10855 [Candidatus Neomarinimicrobiota bacterium]
MKSITGIILSVILLTVTSGQNVPISPDHPVNGFIYRQVILGNIPVANIGTRPFKITAIRSTLTELSKIKSTLGITDQKLLIAYLNEFNIDFNRGVSSFFTPNSLGNTIKSLLIKYDPAIPHRPLFSFHDDSTVIWINWNESLISTISSDSKSVFTDQLRFNLYADNQLTVYSDFLMYRFLGDQSEVNRSEFYHNDWTKYVPDLDWTFWYRTLATVSINSNLADVEISKMPVVWGYSQASSPILSGSAPNFPFIGLSKSLDRIRVSWIHGALSSNTSPDNTRQQFKAKFISAHRVEFDFSNDLTVSFNEMVVYGNRAIELEYLIPVNFYWAAEHNLGDRDNILMALDMFWRIRPGLAWYNTFLWDELDWLKIFQPWWGNKFIFQTGVHWMSTTCNMPDVTVEYTLARPWVYSHKDTVNTYTSASIGLGLPAGPNSQSLSCELFWPINASISFNINYLLSICGSGPGSSPNDNYLSRDFSMDQNTPALIGVINHYSALQFGWHYNISNVLSLTGTIEPKLKSNNSNRLIIEIKSKL